MRHPCPAAWTLAAGTTVLLGILTAGCIRTTTHHPVGALGAGPLRAVPAVAAWDVIDHGRRVGSVLRFEGTGVESAPIEVLHVVRNENGQDLGFVDAQGRAWRRRPHADEELLGSGPLDDGVRRVLGASASVELVPRSLDAPSSPEEPTPPR
jgi:hypothetical protein